MKKAIAIVALAATFAIAFVSCGGEKEKIGTCGACETENVVINTVKEGLDLCKDCKAVYSEGKCDICREKGAVYEVEAFGVKAHLCASCRKSANSALDDLNSLTGSVLKGAGDLTDKALKEAESMVDQALKEATGLTDEALKETEDLLKGLLDF